MPRLLLCSLFIVLLTLTGCRDSLVGVSEAPILQDPDAPALQTPYFKGPEVVDVGIEHQFRVQSVEDAAYYQWVFQSDAGVTIEGALGSDAYGLERVLDARVLAPGLVRMTVSVFDASDTKIAQTAKSVLALDD